MLFSLLFFSSSLYDVLRDDDDELFSSAFLCMGGVLAWRQRSMNTYRGEKRGSDFARDGYTLDSTCIARFAYRGLNPVGDHP